jgi:hypothetical protein
MHVTVMKVNCTEKKNFHVCLLPLLLTALVVGRGVPASAKDDASKNGLRERGAYLEGIPGMMKRLGDVIAGMRAKPDAEGKYTIRISSGGYYDPIDRQRFFYDKKAEIFMSQGKISKIVFVYYRFSFTNGVRQVKTLVNANPYSDDLTSLEISYSTNTGVNESCKVGDLQSPQIRKQVVDQYSGYLLSLIQSLEISRQADKIAESEKIERSVMLDK